MTQGDAIVKEAYTWLGTPHINGAKVKGRGVDCGMLLIGATEGAGLIPTGKVQVPAYSNEWHLHHSEEFFRRYIETYCRKIPPEDMKPGDFLLYQYGRCCSHGGIYAGEGRVIHALVNQGVVLSSMDDVMFKDARGRSRLRGVYRYEGGQS